MKFEKSFSMGNVVTLIVFVAGLAAQWGGYQFMVQEQDRRIAAVEAGLNEIKKDGRVVEALQRVAVIENNVIWIRADVADIKKTLKGAE